MTDLNFKKAQRPLGISVRWEEEGDDSKSVYLGDVVQGEYMSKKEDVGPNASTLYEVKLDDGKVVNVWGNIILDDCFASGNEGNEVPVGAIVRVTFLGIRQGKAGPSKQDGKGYKMFQLEFAIPSPAFKASGKSVAAKVQSTGAALAEGEKTAGKPEAADDEDGY